MSDHEYISLLDLPTRPQIFRLFFHSGKIVIFNVACSVIFAFIFTLFQLTQTVFSWKTVYVFLGCMLALWLFIAVARVLHAIGRYVFALEDRAKLMRKKLLAVATIDADAPAVQAKTNIIRIAHDDQTGSVQLIFQRSGGSGIERGSRLAVIETATAELYGRVQVVSMVGDYATATPVDRVKAEFWDQLEGRMRQEPHPPHGFHLEPDIPDWMRYETGN